ncbi:hypothetical protein F4604DRAFT_1161757 [Suillus subluteus]|nr:hypothetical protein F4604DRAFT_1161757 [Suillus subluteus]
MPMPMTQEGVNLSLLFMRLGLCSHFSFHPEHQRLPVLFQLRIAVPQDHIHSKVSWDIGEAGLSTTEVPVVIIGSGMRCTVFNLSISTSLHSRDILGNNNNRETWSRRGLGGAMVHARSHILNHIIKSLLFFSFLSFLALFSVFSFRLCEKHVHHARHAFVLSSLSRCAVHVCEH